MYFRIKSDSRIPHGDSPVTGRTEPSVGRHVSGQTRVVLCRDGINNSAGETSAGSLQIFCIWSAMSQHGSDFNASFLFIHNCYGSFTAACGSAFPYGGTKPD